MLIHASSLSTLKCKAHVSANLRGNFVLLNVTYLFLNFFIANEDV